MAMTPSLNVVAKEEPAPARRAIMERFSAAPASTSPQPLGALAWRRPFKIIISGRACAPFPRIGRRLFHRITYI